MSRKKISIDVLNDISEVDSSVGEDIVVMPTEFVPIDTENFTDDEARLLEECEEVIERGLETFIEVGQALSEIRSKKLYRKQFASFNDYCKQRWSLGDRYARQLMNAHKVVQILKTGAVAPVLPSSEWQIRPLTKLKSSKQQLEVWQEVVRLAESRDVEINAKLVQEVVDRKLEDMEEEGDALFDGKNYLNTAQKIKNQFFRAIKKELKSETQSIMVEVPSRLIQSEELYQILEIDPGSVNEGYVKISLAKIFDELKK